MKKQYFNKPNILKSEIDMAGKRRIWVEMAEGEALMFKLPGNTKVTEIQSFVEAELQKLKDRQLLEEQIEQLEEQATLLKQQLGI